MSRWARVVVWAVVFATCAAAGAWLASRTDPFPPGVEDPGARSTVEPSGSPTQRVAPTLTGSFRATTEHRLHVGGTCRSDWRATYRLRLQEDGSIGMVTGVAALVPGSARCDFDQAQAQTDTVDLEISGTWEGRGRRRQLRLRFREAGREPEGSLDVGGFVPTIEAVRAVLEPTADRSVGRLGGLEDVRLSDGNQGEYAATYRFEATCRRGCR